MNDGAALLLAVCRDVGDAIECSVLDVELDSGGLADAGVAVHGVHFVLENPVVLHIGEDLNQRRCTVVLDHLYQFRLVGLVELLDNSEGDGVVHPHAVCQVGVTVEEGLVFVEALLEIQAEAVDVRHPEPTKAPQARKAAACLVPKTRRKLVQPNRKKYCISELEGKEIIRESQERKALLDSWKERDEKKELYQDIAKIQKLTIVELQTLLDPLIEKAGYTKLEFEKPVLEKDVILGFSLQDAKSGRGDYDSRHELQKLLKKALSSTNWRLMSDGVTYRLGFLQGRLRGIEGEEKLKELLESEQKKRDKTRKEEKPTISGQKTIFNV